jgi:hypothetical protein
MILSALGVSKRATFLYSKYMKRLGQCHLYPLLEHPETNIIFSVGNQTRAACVTGEHSSKELFEQLMLLLFGTSTNINFFKNILC